MVLLFGPVWKNKNLCFIFCFEFFQILYSFSPHCLSLFLPGYNFFFIFSAVLSPFFYVRTWTAITVDYRCIRTTTVRNRKLKLSPKKFVVSLSPTIIATEEFIFLLLHFSSYFIFKTSSSFFFVSFVVFVNTSVLMLVNIW